MKEKYFLIYFWRNKKATLFRRLGGSIGEIPTGKLILLALNLVAALVSGYCCWQTHKAAKEAEKAFRRFRGKQEDNWK